MPSGLSLRIPHTVVALALSCLFLVTSATELPVDGCSVNYAGSTGAGNQTVSLAYFSGNISVGNLTGTLSPCGNTTTFANCGTKAGYFALYDSKSCLAVYDVLNRIVFDPATGTFTLQLSTAASTLWLEASCVMGVTNLAGQALQRNASNPAAPDRVWVVPSMFVCPGYDPSWIHGHTIARRTIVGICVACVAMIFIIGLLIKWNLEDSSGKFDRSAKEDPVDSDGYQSIS